ncbi:4Fe-4S dicluster domain-containing protein [uncultured Draconibacterium sp.]|uniref:4Fe-4S dicluster domain-containing protein n=1 Tax=uncultured Draconibacterium sp. TaxID=1573823 RepID=UPI003216CDFF
MQKLTIYFVLCSYALLGVFMLSFIILSWFEKEYKALKRALLILVIYIIILFLLSFLPDSIFYLLTVLVLMVLFLIVLNFGNKNIEFNLPENRFDERDVMFSRNTLIKGTDKFEEYYKNRPENKIADDNFRKEPGLLAKGAALYNELLFTAAKATFSSVNLLQPLVSRESNALQTKFSEKEIETFIRKWAIQLGAADIGFTRIKPHHIYSHIGRGEDYGQKVVLNHKYAIAFTVEMNHESMTFNPRGPVIVESAQQYLNAGTIAVLLAEFLRNLGFEARAHIDANYRLICPIVAQDAGLGTIGRMGLLITPKLGPRVRIGLVSTNLELTPSEEPIDKSVIHFCEVCKKCATNCPSQSIPHTSVKKVNQPKRWQINHDTCFNYWCKTGTDCGRCIAVCPYAHPNNFLHNFIRWIIKRNPINRWFAIKLDDYFYGKKPRSAKLKSWMLARNS